MEILGLKSIIFEIKTSLDGLNSRIKKTEARIIKFKIRSTEIIQNEEQGKKVKNKIK